jgi:hypothetical protein
VDTTCTEEKIDTNNGVLLVWVFHWYYVCKTYIIVTHSTQPPCLALHLETVTFFSSTSFTLSTMPFAIHACLLSGMYSQPTRNRVAI